MTVNDFVECAEEMTVDNDSEWVDFDQQQTQARRNELAVQSFWKAQDLATLRRVYKAVFPGIKDAVNDSTKKAHLDVIAEFLKNKEQGKDAINIEAAAGLDRAPSDSKTGKRREATRSFFSNSDFAEPSQHYFDAASLDW